jgi:hypothetical protein
VSCPRNKFKKFAERLKAFCSLSDYFGDASFAALNQKNSTSLTLGTQTAFDFLRPASAGIFSQNTRMSLAKTFQPP